LYIEGSACVLARIILAIVPFCLSNIPILCNTCSLGIYYYFYA
jgi:hypothetical protein